MGLNVLTCKNYSIVVMACKADVGAAGARVMIVANE